MTSVSPGASAGLRARFSNWKQGRKEEAAKKQGQAYLSSRLSRTFDLYPRTAKIWQSPKIAVPPQKLPCATTLLEF